MHGCLPNSGSRRTTGLGLHTDVADKQGSGLQNRPMQERYLPSVPFFRERSVVSLHVSLKPRRCWCDSNRSHFSQQEAESPPPVSYAGCFPCNSESCSHFFGA